MDFDQACDLSEAFALCFAAWAGAVALGLFGYLLGGPSAALASVFFLFFAIPGTLRFRKMVRDLHDPHWLRAWTIIMWLKGPPPDWKPKHMR